MKVDPFEMPESLEHQLASARASAAQNLLAAQTTADTLVTALERLQLYKDLVDAAIAWRADPATTCRSDAEVRLWKLVDQERIRRKEEH